MTTAAVTPPLSHPRHAGLTALHVALGALADDDPPGRCPVAEAVLPCLPAAACLLAKHGAVHHPTAGGATTTLTAHAAVYLAVAFGEPDLVALALRAGARVDAVDARGRTAIMFAACPESEEPWECAEVLSQAIDALLDAGADVNAEDEDGATALEYALQSRPFECADVLRALLRAPGLQCRDTMGASGWSALHAACCPAHADLVEAALKAGADVHLPTLGGDSPLRMLLIHADDGTWSDEEGLRGALCQLLHAAALLLAADADPATAQIHGLPAPVFALALASGIVRMRLDMESDDDDVDGQHPLDVALYAFATTVAAIPDFNPLERFTWSFKDPRVPHLC